jgi:NodT family efflux transporter outer membrane factor (OMF) lipoprotein
VKLSRQQLIIASKRSHQGIDSVIPLKTLENNLQSATQLQAEVQQAKQLAEHQLAVLMGNNPLASEILIQPTPDFNYKIPVKSNLPANLLANRPDIQAAKWRAQAAAHRINVAKARFFPDINLNALFSYQGVSTGFAHLFDPGNQTNAVTAAIDLPIFDAGLRRANLGARYADYDLAVAFYNQTLLTALQQVADQLTTVHTVNKQLSDEKRAVQAINQRYKLIQSRYNHGIDDYSIVIESKQVLLQRLAAKQTLQTRRLQAIVNLIKALGGSDSKDS